jgi:hypothetical protein
MKPIRCALLLLVALPVVAVAQFTVEETPEKVTIASPELEAAVNKKGYVSGIAGGSFLDKQTGFRDPGFGLDIVDWVMEDGSDEAYRERLPKEMVYEFGNAFHGKTAKRSIEGPQICTQAKEVTPAVVRGTDFVAVKTSWQYRTAAPGYMAGSMWSQTIVFPAGKRYFVSSDTVTSVNDLRQPFLRLDLPGHVKHKGGDTFSQIYLSYHGKGPIPSSEFVKDFAPDEKFNYRRDRDKAPARFIRAYRLRDPKTGKDGPWLAGMTLRPEVVTEAWCHQRGYVCMIEEFGPPIGKGVKAGEAFSAAFIVGYFDSIQEMEKVYDEYAGAVRVEATAAGWKVIK